MRGLPGESRAGGHSWLQPQVRPAWRQCLKCSWRLLYKPQWGAGILVTGLSSGANTRCGHLQLRRGALQGSTARQHCLDAAGGCAAWQRSKLCSRARNRVPSVVTAEASDVAMDPQCMPGCDRKLLTALLLWCPLLSSQQSSGNDSASACCAWTLPTSRGAALGKMLPQLAQL